MIEYTWIQTAKHGQIMRVSANDYLSRPANGGMSKTRHFSSFAQAMKWADRSVY